MQKIREQFKVFMTDFEQRIKKLGLSLNDYPIDHVCYRVKTKEEYKSLKEIFREESILYTEKFFHERYFNLFVLKNPFEYKGVLVYSLEFAEPGGSDDYNLGFQHLEFHANTSAEDLDLVKDKEVVKSLLCAGKYGDEKYLKWPDKMALKVTKKSIILESLTEDKPKIFVEK